MLQPKQNIFMALIAQFILIVQSKKWTVTAGEAYRPTFVEKIYVNRGLSKGMNSFHCKRLAMDLNFFEPESEKPCYEKDKIKELAEIWKSLHPNCVWGGDFKNINDTDHFEFNPDVINSKFDNSIDISDWNKKVLANENITKLIDAEKKEV